MIACSSSTLMLQPSGRCQFISVLRRTANSRDILSLPIILSMVVRHLWMKQVLFASRPLTSRCVYTPFRNSTFLFPFISDFGHWAVTQFNRQTDKTKKQKTWRTLLENRTPKTITTLAKRDALFTISFCILHLPVAVALPGLISTLQPRTKATTRTINHATIFSSAPSHAMRFTSPLN